MEIRVVNPQNIGYDEEFTVIVTDLPEDFHTLTISDFEVKFLRYSHSQQQARYIALFSDNLKPNDSVKSCRLVIKNDVMKNAEFLIVSVFSKTQKKFIDAALEVNFI